MNPTLQDQEEIMTEMTTEEEMIEMIVDQEEAIEMIEEEVEPEVEVLHIEPHLEIIPTTIDLMIEMIEMTEEMEISQSISKICHLNWMKAI